MALIEVDIVGSCIKDIVTFMKQYNHKKYPCLLDVGYEDFNINLINLVSLKGPKSITNVNLRLISKMPRTIDTKVDALICVIDLSDKNSVNTIKEMEKYYKSPKKFYHIIENGNQIDDDMFQYLKSTGCRVTQGTSIKSLTYLIEDIIDYFDK